jgi:uncharacterized protein YxjI
MSEKFEIKSIKDIQIEKDALLTDVMHLEKNIEALQREFNIKNADLNMCVLKERNYTKRKKIKVSDHSVIRYLERIKGMDIDAIRDKILSLNIDVKHEYIEDGTYDMGTFNIVLIKNTVVTLYKGESHE